MDKENPRWPAALLRYVVLLSAFAEERLTAPEFETLYLAMFKSDPSEHGESTFHLIERVFFDVDSYVADPELRRATGGIDELELRNRAVKALGELEQLLVDLTAN